MHQSPKELERVASLQRTQTINLKPDQTASHYWYIKEREH